MGTCFWHDHSTPCPYCAEDYAQSQREAEEKERVIKQVKREKDKLISFNRDVESRKNCINLAKNISDEDFLKLIESIDRFRLTYYYQTYKKKRCSDQQVLKYFKSEEPFDFDDLKNYRY